MLSTIQRLQTLRPRIGEWSFVRALRNTGVTFETAYYLTFGQQPKRLDARKVLH